MKDWDIITSIPNCCIIRDWYKSASDKISFAKQINGYQESMPNEEFISLLRSKNQLDKLNCIHAYFKIPKDRFYDLTVYLNLYNNQYVYAFDNDDEYMLVNLPYSIIYKMYFNRNNAIIRLLNNCIITDENTKLHINKAVTFMIEAPRKDLDELERLGISYNTRTKFIDECCNSENGILNFMQPVALNTASDNDRTDYQMTCDYLIRNYEATHDNNVLGGYVIDCQYLTITKKNFDKLAQLNPDIDGNLYQLMCKIYNTWTNDIGIWTPYD